MSDIRFNRWLHGTGSGGVSQDSSGNIGIGTSVPRSSLDVEGFVRVLNGVNVSGVSTLGNATATTLSVSGVSTVAAGSTAAPSISPTGDTDTGIFFPAADTIAFGEGGVESVRIDSSGRLGIGTNNPTQTLQVGFGTNAVTITGVGSIGVGTASPTAKLHVFGNAAGFIGTASTTSGSGISTVNFDFGSANNFSFTLTGNYTIANPINLVVGQSGFISLLQDGTGSRTASFGSFWDFANSTAPTLTTTASGVDVLAYYVRTSGAGGTSIVSDVILGVGT